MKTLYTYSVHYTLITYRNRKSFPSRKFILTRKEHICRVPKKTSILYTTIMSMLPTLWSLK